MSFFQQRIRSFGFAFKGIYTFFREQVHARIHLLAIVLLLGLSFWVGLAAWEWVAVLICMALVILAEALNTAIEYLTDLVSPDYHPLAGKVKDIAAAAVLLTVFFCAAVWAIIFVPKLWALVG